MSIAHHRRAPVTPFDEIPHTLRLSLQLLDLLTAGSHGKHTFGLGLDTQSTLHALIIVQQSDARFRLGQQLLSFCRVRVALHKHRFVHM